MRWFITLTLLALVGCESGVDTAEAVDSSWIDADGDGYREDVDCNDADPDVHPGALELCDGVDSNCAAGDSDAEDALRWFYDRDGDRYPDQSSWVDSCESVEDHVVEDDVVGWDCDDTDSDVNPGAIAELCNGYDDYCDGFVDDADTEDVLPSTIWFADSDGDGYGYAPVYELACDQPANTTLNGDDCDDDDAQVHPDAEERCDGIDNDCNGEVDVDVEGIDVTAVADTVLILGGSPRQDVTLFELCVGKNEFWVDELTVFISHDYASSFEVNEAEVNGKRFDFLDDIDKPTTFPDTDIYAGDVYAARYGAYYGDLPRLSPERSTAVILEVYLDLEEEEEAASGVVCLGAVVDSTRTLHERYACVAITHHEA